MEELIDKHLLGVENHWFPGGIARAMADPSQDESDDWRIWHPIPSTVSDDEIQEVEKELGHKLPQAYKRFLQHRHFYELKIGSCLFFGHPSDAWKDSLYKNIFDGYPRDLLIDVGRIPFANWEDWGLLCFDTTLAAENNNYPIVLWDHGMWNDEIHNQFDFVYDDFESMLVELDKQANENAPHPLS